MFASKLCKHHLRARSLPLVGLFFAGCAAADDYAHTEAGDAQTAPNADSSNLAERDVSPDPEIGSAREAQTSTPRSDYAATITPPGGPWGFLRQAKYCNSGTYAVGFTQRVEQSQDGGDDTALNSVNLLCATSPEAEVTDRVSSHDGFWGEWTREPARCNGFVTGARLRLESDQGGGDDTSANGIQMSCSAGEDINADNDGPWGEYDRPEDTWRSCPENTKVCGLRIQLEEKLSGRRDDTAMNGLELYCCN